MKKFTYKGLGLAAMLVLAGCVDPVQMTAEEREVLRGKETIADSFGSGVANYGNATRANMATHIVDPAPAYSEDPPDIDGQVILGGYGRYRTGKVKPPKPIGGF